MCKECLYLCYLMVYLYLNPKQNGLAQRFPSPKDPQDTANIRTAQLCVLRLRWLRSPQDTGDPCAIKHNI